MSLELCILASGSSGNCAALRTSAGVILIDAGLGPRTTAQRMNGTGISLNDVRAICLTHLDRDHFNPAWLDTLRSRGIRVHCHRSRVQFLVELLGEDDAAALINGFEDSFEPLEGVGIRTISLAHDRAGSHGFVVSVNGCRLGYATDLGRVPEALIEYFADLDLLAIESNYDPQMQLESARPQFLKSRIMNGSGHLSNEQAFEAVKIILDAAERRRRPLPRHIVLLHRSRQCNCPKIVRRLFERDSRITQRLTLAEQFVRSDWLHVRPRRPLVGEQLSLQFG